MLTIGQFSKTCMVTVKTLHHYDKIGLIHPARIDAETGYRFYSMKQVSQMLLIQRLKRYGFSLTEIREMTTCGDAGLLQSRLHRQKELLNRRLEDEAFVLRELDDHLHYFERTGDMMGYLNQYHISIEEKEAMPVLSSRQKMSTEDFGACFGKLFEQVAREKIGGIGKTMTMYHDVEFNPDCNDTEVAIILEDAAQATRVIDGGLCATTIHRGAYSSLGDAYGALARWIEENDYVPAGAPYEIYMKNQFEGLKPEDWETQVFFPVRKK